MARIRTIKPEFPQSESMGRVSRNERLLFILLWTLCDDEGRCRASSRMLASLLFPYDDDVPNLIEAWLVKLEAEQCIVRYEVKGNSYLQIENWSKHQKIDRPSASKIPPPPERSRNLASIREASALDQGPKDQRIKGGEANARENWFDEFFEACPKKVGRVETRRQFEVALGKTDAETIIDAMRQYAASRKGADEKFVKEPANWLSAERWKDYTTTKIAAVEPAALAEMRARWGGRAAGIIDEVGLANFVSWLKDCAVDGDPPTKLIAPSDLKASEIRRRFLPQIRRGLGDVVVEVAA
jgi:hypothetical protein